MRKILIYCISLMSICCALSEENNSQLPLVAEDNSRIVLHQWTQPDSNYYFIYNGEDCYFGKYHFEIDGRPYYIDLRCREGDLVQSAFCRLFTYLSTGELYYDDIFRRLPEYEGRRLSPEEFRSVCELFVEENWKKIEEHVRKIEDGHRIMSDDEWSNLAVGSYTEPAKYWSWKEIDKCGHEYADKRFLLLTQYCPDCGSQVVKSYFCSPPWTWQNLCGREGWIFFCPKCQKQLGFELTKMN